MIETHPIKAPFVVLCLLTRSPEETQKVGEIIGQAAIDIDAENFVIALEGDLGAGKTVLVQGLARGIGVPPEYVVTSPTYTLINEYPGRVRLAHADLYRISRLEDAEDIGLDEICRRPGVLAVEWAERLPPGALRENLSIRITHEGETRRLELNFYGRVNGSLIERLKTHFLTH